MDGMNLASECLICIGVRLRMKEIEISLERVTPLGLRKAMHTSIISDVMCLLKLCHNTC